MANLIAIAVALLLLASVGGLLVWALSALCRFLTVFAPDPSDTPAP